MNLRLAAALLATAFALSACSGSDSDSEGTATVPDDQVIQPADGTPSGFTETDLGAVSIAVPSDWDKQPETKPADNITSTVWRGQVQDGIATGGVDVRVITDPQQPADKAAQALAISAMATLGGRNIEPQEIVWPKASSAYFLEYEAQAPIPTASPSASASPAVTPELATRTLVLDLADGTQVQVTALSADSQDVPAEVLSTVVVKAEASEG